MVTNERRWDIDLIIDIFEQRDANLIVATPLSSFDSDNWYWKKERFGNYSVKSAYILSQENKSYINPCGNPRFWKRLWFLKVPPRVKNFIWRAITDCLPTKVLLSMKHVELNVVCPMCNEEVESTTHILINCSFAQACWEKIGGSEGVDTQVTFINWMLNIFDRWDKDRRQMGVMVCWSIWKSRNELVWSQRCLEVGDVVESARVVLSQWQDAQDRIFDRSWGLINPDDGDEHWTLPMDDKTKVNTDAAIFHTPNCYSYAFVARNNKGELIEARSSCKPGHINPNSAETMSIREALSWIKDKQLTEVTVETDCFVAVQAIRGNETMHSYFGKTVQDCRELLLQLKDKGVNLRFVKRSANNVAHALAKCSYSIADRIWHAHEACPGLKYVIENDLKH